MKWKASGSTLLLLVWLFVGTACRPATPQPWVDHAVCYTTFPARPFECHFNLNNPDTADPVHPFKWVLSISNPQQVEVTPATSGMLVAGERVTIVAVIHQCPATIHILDASQQAKPSLWTLHEPVCTTS